MKVQILTAGIILTLCAGCSAPSSNVEVTPLALPSDISSGLYGDIVGDISKVFAEKDAVAESELSSWKEVNQDVCALIEVKDLGIAEPVIAAKDNSTWLRTNIYGEYDISGSVFLDYRCDLYSNPVKLIHGHNMLNGTMFSNLPALFNLENCDEAPVIRLYTADGWLTYKIFSVISVNSKEEALPVDVLASGQQIKDMAQELLSRSAVPGGVINTYDLLVLNTCWYGQSGKEHNLHCIVSASRI